MQVSCRSLASGLSSTQTALRQVALLPFWSTEALLKLRCASESPGALIITIIIIT